MIRWFINLHHWAGRSDGGCLMLILIVLDVCLGYAIFLGAGWVIWTTVQTALQFGAQR